VDNSRWPQVGDLLIEKLKSSGETYTGLIYKVNGVEGRVFIKWSGKAPYGYYEEHGYSPVNIHNEFNKFTLVKT